VKAVVTRQKKYSVITMYPGIHERDEKPEVFYVGEFPSEQVGSEK
jgi:hypothetical protein